MKNLISDVSLRKATIVAGLGLLIMTIFAILGMFAQSLIVPGDAAKTVNNIIASEGRFRIGIFSFMVVIILDVVVAWALYVLFKPVNKSLSLLTAWFRLVYSTIFGIAVANLFFVLLLLSGADYLKVLETDQLHAQVMLFLNAFNLVWDIGFVFFGLHLFGLGYLVFKSRSILFKSGYIPIVLGIFLIIASFGYLIDSFGKFLIHNYEVNIAAVTGFGEIVLMLWLLWRGAKGFDKELLEKMNIQG